MIEIHTGDCCAALKKFTAESVQCVVTSPPYDELRTYGGYEFRFEETARELFRVLCDGGVLCWNIKDAIIEGSESLTSCTHKIYLARVCGFRVRTIIYQKRNFSHPQKGFYHSVFEYVFICSKGKPRAFNPLMDRKNITAGAVGNLGVNTFTERDGSKSVRAKKVTKEFGMRHDVWLGLTRGQEEMCKRLPHPAMMPKWLARDLILSWSNPGDVVLDPFAGSFTTCKIALKLGRIPIGIEINPEYAQEALKIAAKEQDRTQGPETAASPAAGREPAAP